MLFVCAIAKRIVRKSAALHVTYALRLQMVDGAVQYRFDCGSGEGLVRVTSIRINDGQWHKLTVERRGNTAELTIDGKARDEASAPGTNDLLNLDRCVEKSGVNVLYRTKTQVPGVKQVAIGF